MENERKYETNTITKKHFASMHVKVQQKFAEMQKRLEKSKSIDVLSSLNDDFDYKSDRRYVSVCDLNEMDKNDFDCDRGQNKYNEDSTDNIMPDDCVDRDVSPNEAMIIKSTSLLSLNDSDSEETIDNHFFNNNLFKKSLESLTEATKESDESIEPLTPTTKSIRDRIGSKISAVRKRRQEDKKRRKEEKQNKVHDKVENFILSNSVKLPSKFEKRNKLGTVTIALIDVTGLEEIVEEKPRVLVCRFRLGSEKRKSKIVKSNESAVKFQEIFNFNLIEEENMLDLTLWDKDILLGRNTIDLYTLKKEKTHKIKIHLEDSISNAQIFMLLTISGCSTSNTVYDHNENTFKKMVDETCKKYKWYRLYSPFSDVGRLWVIVYGAKGLSVSDSYCDLHLDNENLRTATDYKTNSPSWMKIFSFTITDITSTLKVNICDEKKSEVIGTVSIPLLALDSRKKWYALKDSTQRQRAKGNNPRILLETRLTWNLVKASVKVINLKETKHLETEEKLDRHLLARHISRTKAILSWIIEFFKMIKVCFEWESQKLNIIALLVWITFFYFAKTWMLPLILLYPFVIYNSDKFLNVDLRKKLRQAISSESDKDAKPDKDEKSVSLRQKINSWQEMLQLAQNYLGTFASTGESIKNLFNFSVPFVSYLAIFLIVVIAFVLYLLPFNYLCIIWSIHKYTRKILRPNRVPNNEILDLLSRVPDDDALIKQEELELESVLEEDE